MGLSKEIILTVKDYEIKLNRDIKFYENDTIDLCFSILEYGIEVKDGVAVNKLMPINALRAYMLIETPQGVDYAESTKVENNRVIFNLGNKYSQFIGIGRMQIVIKDNDGCRVTLPEFPFEIRESINSDWEKVTTFLSTENSEIIIDEFGKKIEMKKISEMEEATVLPINSYSMILDNNGNKKIKTNLITQKIENDLQLINEQLGQKADKTAIQNIQQQVNGNNAEIIQARGEYDVLNDRLDSIDSENIKNISINLLSTNKYIGENTNGAIATKVDDKTYRVECTESWGGTFNRRVKISNGKTYLIISKVKANSDNDLGKNCGFYCYQYSSDGVNLGAISPIADDYYIASTSLTSDYTTLHYAFTPTQEEVDYIDLGLTIPSQGATFVVTEQIILDVTSLTKDMIKTINFPNMEYWSGKIDNYVLYSRVSNYSKESGTSNIANSLDSEYHDSLKQECYLEAQRYTNAKLSEALSTPFVNETDKLTWTSLTREAGTSSGYWFDNITSNLSSNSHYLYIVRWVGGNKDAFLRCEELRNYVWYPTSSIVNEHSENDEEKIQSFIFSTDDTVTSPNICCVTNNVTLETNINLTAELYRITNSKYVDEMFAYKIAVAYEKGNTIDTYDFSDKPKWEVANKWSGKNVLVIGDSITAARKWQLKLSEELGMNVTTHAKGGVGAIQMVDGDKGLGGDYDNETNADGTLLPLTVEDVQDKDLIVLLPCYNDRGKEDGEIGDCYDPSNETNNNIVGVVQYAINRIYEELKKANNLNCKILIATPHCVGKYNYVDANGYEEYPTNSGRTMETMCNIIKGVANHNNIHVCDLWHNSGINKFTWGIYGANPNPVNEFYTKYELNANGETIGQTPLRYVTGNSYYQIRDGVVVLEQYTGMSPCPYNGDQLHCSDLGYARIGECIVGAIINAYGY